MAGLGGISTFSYCSGRGVILIVPEVKSINGIVTLGADFLQIRGNVPRVIGDIEADIAGVNGRIIVQLAAVDIEALVVHQLEPAIITCPRYCNSKGAGRIRCLNRAGGHRHDLHGHQPALIVEAHAQEIRAVCVSVQAGIRVQIGLGPRGAAVGVPVVEIDRNLVIYAGVRVLLEHGGHDVALVLVLRAVGLRHNGGGSMGVQITGQVMAGGAVGGVHIVIVHTGIRSLRQHVGQGRIAALGDHQLGGDALFAGIIVKVIVPAEGIAVDFLEFDAAAWIAIRQTVMVLNLLQRDILVSSVICHLDQQPVIDRLIALRDITSVFINEVGLDLEFRQLGDNDLAFAVGTRVVSGHNILVNRVAGPRG